MAAKDIGKIIATVPPENEQISKKFALKRNFLFWKNYLKASSFVLNVLNNGYIIPFHYPPTKFCAKNNASALRNKQFVTDEIEKLSNKGFVAEKFREPFCCNPLTVAEKGKLRLVLDLRHVNKFINEKHFRYEDLNCLAEILEKDDFFVRFDLTAGYHHVDINEHCQKYLGFAWADGERDRFYEFTVLPFGLSPAGYVFSKIMRPITKCWRGQGFKVVIFLDDGIASNGGSAETKILADIIQSDLKRAGFSVNFTKSDFTPTKRGEWLGMIVDTEKMTFQVPTEKILKLKEKILHVLTNKFVKAKELAAITGTLSSMHKAIGSLVRFYTRSMYADIAKTDTWFDNIQISPKTLHELVFWLQNIIYLNGLSFIKNPTTAKMVLQTDASSVGYGGYMVHRLEKLICCGKFSDIDKTSSSTFRELLAVKLVLKSYGKILHDEVIQIYTDNFNVSRILQIGSAKEYLHDIALEIYLYCLKHNIKIELQWIPREENYTADFYSKFNDSDGWGVDRETFHEINKHFGPLSVDRFADDRNAKLKKFNSKFYCPGTAQVDCFTANRPFPLLFEFAKHYGKCIYQPRNMKKTYRELCL